MQPTANLLILERQRYAEARRVPKHEGAVQTAVRGDLGSSPLDGLFRNWLMPRLKLAGINQAIVARALGQSPVVIQEWFAGKPISNTHLSQLGILLILSPADAKELHFISSIHSVNNKIRLIFNKKRIAHQPGKAMLDRSFIAGFKFPEIIYNRLIHYIVNMAGHDVNVFGLHSIYEYIFIHLAAAWRCISDIIDFIDNGNNLFHSDNIEAHIRYPFNYYIAFFLEQITPDDGPGVGELKSRILDFFDTRIDEKNASRGNDLRVAQHCLHMLIRHGTDDQAASLRKLMNSSNLETQRMALFGQLFREECRSDAYRKLVTQLSSSPEFAQLTVAFDICHYGDVPVYSPTPSPKAIPLNTLARQIYALSDDRRFARGLAALRMLNIVQFYSGALRSSVGFKERFNEASIDALRRRDGGELEHKALNKLMELFKES